MTCLFDRDAMGLHLLTALARVMPPVLSRYTDRPACVFTSVVMVKVLSVLGIKARVLPCVVRLDLPGGYYLLGHREAELPSGQWPGHVACLVEERILCDPSIGQIARLGAAEPPAIVALRWQGEGTRLALPKGEGLSWWLRNANPHWREVEYLGHPMLAAVIRDLLAAMGDMVQSSPSEPRNHALPFPGQGVKSLGAFSTSARP